MKVIVHVLSRPRQHLAIYITRHPHKLALSRVELMERTSNFVSPGEFIAPVINEIYRFETF